MTRATRRSRKASFWTVKYEDWTCSVDLRLTYLETSGEAFAEFILTSPDGLCMHGHTGCTCGGKSVEKRTAPIVIERAAVSRSIFFVKVGTFGAHSGIINVAERWASAEAQALLSAAKASRALAFPAPEPVSDEPAFVSITSGYDIAEPTTEPTTSYTCRLCGSEDLVEVSLVPRIYPLDPDTGELDTMTGGDEAFWESETVLGYGCMTDSCANWQGDFGIRVQADGTFTVDVAPTLEALTGRAA